MQLCSNQTPESSWRAEMRAKQKGLQQFQVTRPRTIRRCGPSTRQFECPICDRVSSISRCDAKILPLAKAESGIGTESDSETSLCEHHRALPLILSRGIQGWRQPIFQSAFPWRKAKLAYTMVMRERNLPEHNPRLVVVHHLDPKVEWALKA